MGVHFAVGENGTETHPPGWSAMAVLEPWWWRKRF
jgi:hypothetical protein